MACPIAETQRVAIGRGARHEELSAGKFHFAPPFRFTITSSAWAFLGMRSRESDAWARFASPTLLLLPQMRKLRGDDALVGNVAGEYADIARELVHAGDKAPRDRGIVIGQIPANELGD